jgi:plastocyanin
MRRPGLVSICLLLAGCGLAGCGGSNPAKNPSLAAGNTTGPTSTTSTTAVAIVTVAASTSTSRPAAARTTTAAPSTTAKPPCTPGGTSLRITAQGIQFNTKCLAAPAGHDFSIALDNKDAGVPHNVAIYSADPVSHPDATLLFRGDLVTGPGATLYQVSALSAGNYFFHCDVHPGLMEGAFIVK